MPIEETFNQVPIRQAAILAATAYYSMRLVLCSLLSSIFFALGSAQFQFFEQMFNQGGQQQQQHQQQQNVASDSEWYQKTHENGQLLSAQSMLLRSVIRWADSHFISAHCTNYLCPGTLSCVAFPHHCPCAFPAQEDKVELADGSAICLSKGGFREGEVARKVELARMGKL